MIEGFAKALGMKVLIAERKGVHTSTHRKGRTPFSTALQRCSVLVIACPLDNTSLNMITQTEFRLMQPHSIVINVARGGVLDEAALVQALKEGWIAGAASGVFAVEPATKTSSPFTREEVPNLTLSPHIAWYADASMEKLQETVKVTVEGFVGGRVVNCVTGSCVPVCGKGA